VSIVAAKPDPFLASLFGPAAAAEIEARRREFDATPPALPAMADWIEAEARSVRSKGSPLAWWLAERIDELARECRHLRATTPDEFDARSEVMSGGPR